MILGNLSETFGGRENAEKILKRCSIDPKKRAENLKLGDWLCLGWLVLQKISATNILISPYLTSNGCHSDFTEESLAYLRDPRQARDDIQLGRKWHSLNKTSLRGWKPVGNPFFLSNFLDCFALLAMTNKYTFSVDNSAFSLYFTQIVHAIIKIGRNSKCMIILPSRNF